MLTQADLNAIKERAEKATPGPWSFDGDFTARINGMLEPVIYAGYGELFVRDEDIDFITSAHTDITKLAAEVERLENAIAEAISDIETISPNEAKKTLLEVIENGEN
jgi:hypothetical protein